MLPARWAVPAIVISGALVVSATVPVDSAHAQVPAGSTPAPEAPDPEDTPAPTPVADPPAPKIEPVDRDGLEVVSRSEFETRYADETGAEVSRLSMDPLNVRVDGTWVDVDPALSGTGDGWTAEQHPLAPDFAPTADGGNTVTVTREGHEVGLSLVGAEEGSTDAPFWAWDDFSSLAYRDVLPDADLEYTITAGSVKEALVLNTAPKATKSSWMWRIDAGDLTPTLTEDDVLEFVDADGEVVMSSPTPIAWDSASDGSDSPREEVVLDAALMRSSGEDWYYRVSADAAWLQDSDRVYPVYIDPEVVGTIANQNSYKSDGGQYLGQQHVGNTKQAEGDRYWRAVVNFAGGAAVGDFIEASDLGITYAGTGSTATHSGNVRVGTKWQYDGYSTLLDSYSLGSGTTQTNGTVFPTYIATQFGKNSASNVAFMISGAEGSVYSHKRVTTDLWVKYHPHVTPAFVTGTGASPANGAAGVSLTPTFKSTATAVTGSSLRYSYRVFTDPSGTPFYTSPETTTAVHRVPDGTLRPGTKYYWRAYVRDAGWDGHLGQSTLRSTGAWGFTTTPMPALDEGREFHEQTGDLYPAPATVIPAGETVTIPVAGLYGMPSFADGLDTVVANVSIRSTTAQGASVRAWASDLVEPDAALLESPSTHWSSTLTPIMVGSDGTILVRNLSASPMEFKLYMLGYAMVPSRVLPVEEGEEPEYLDPIDDSQDQFLEGDPDATSDEPEPEAPPEALLVENETGEFLVTPEELTPIEALDVTVGAGPVADGSVVPFGFIPPKSPKPTDWRGCGLFDKNEQYVKDYTRKRLRNSFVGTVATLRCGSHITKPEYGYRHIQGGKQATWTTVGGRVGVQWRDMADWSIAWMLYDPDQFAAAGPNWCYSRVVYVYNKKTGAKVYERKVEMYVGKTGQRIITAFPGDGCDGTNLLRR